MKTTIRLCAALTTCTTIAFAQDIDRTHLPIEAPVYPPITELDARNATPPPRFEVTAPKGAPNVVLVLIDDIGFGTAGSFGGSINTPTLDRLAADGLRYNQFHTTALCSPTRIALLSGRNHHSANAGSVMEVATAFPGNQGVRPKSVEYVAEMLRLNGYSTAAFGKWHETAPWEVSISGPHDRWPTRSGFDKFYGFIGGETNQWAPFLHDGVAPVRDPRRPRLPRHDRPGGREAIEWMKFQQALTPDKPFFVYFATGADPRSAPRPPGVDRQVQGQVRCGLERLPRGDARAAESSSASSPRARSSPPMPEDIKDWGSLSRRGAAALRPSDGDVYAAFTSHTDHEVGRLVDALDDIGELDNTLFIYVWGDNGSSAEGGLSGTFNELITLNGLADTVEDQQCPTSTTSAAKTPTTTSTRAGPAPRTHPSNGPSRSPRTTAARATRMVVHWPAGFESNRARNPLAVAPRHRRRPHHHGSRRPAVPRLRQRCQAEAVRGRQHRLLLRR